MVGLFGGATLASQSVAVLDVGQGDAILVSGGGGHYALVDTGPDPVVLLERLRHYHIDAVDLVVLTHLHADHIGGASALLGRVAIGQIWADPSLHATNESIELFDRIDAMGLSVVTPTPSATLILGALKLTVLGPERRYAESNDQSIVILVEGSSATMLLAGDAEVAEQGDIGPVPADVLKVPHHGGATSDPDWLSAVGARSAVISVGENMFGHPSESVVSLLEAGGAIVLRTDLDGDVIVPLG
jgi:competence protein ComEC